MGTFSIWHLLLLAGIVLVLFGGKGKISEIMGDFAKGIKSFKKGMTEDEVAAKPADTSKTIEGQPVAKTGDQQPQVQSKVG
jgi:sec-independent protein translocase protein TatA